MKESDILYELRYIRKCSAFNNKDEMVLLYKKLVEETNKKTIKKLVDFVYDTKMSNEEIIKKMEIDITKETDSVKEILDNTQKNNKELASTTSHTDKNSISSKPDWQWLLFLIILFLAVVLPILMITFDFGPTEKSDSIEDMNQQEYNAKLWSR